MGGEADQDVRQCPGEVGTVRQGLYKAIWRQKPLSCYYRKMDGKESECLHQRIAWEIRH